jgi:hypothetical protein
MILQSAKHDSETNENPYSKGREGPLPDGRYVQVEQDTWWETKSTDLVVTAMVLDANPAVGVVQYTTDCLPNPEGSHSGDETTR